jgi:hypothetical protein
MTIADTIEESVSKYKEILKTTIKSYDASKGFLQNKEPKRLRELYGVQMEEYTKSKDIIKDNKEFVEKIMKELEECKSLLIENEKMIEDKIIVLNKAKIGTLEGLSREAINKNKIPLDEHAQTVMEQPYNELAEIGGKNSSKRNKTKRKTHKVKKSNKSKNRRLKRTA